ncbi:hypothetical protein F511_38058 [Dorcoceras hygrometricum]|uniref:Uncharacterized protein n=1 Tax=Dorcoceras hygrometricum TaxID=472368 RepID=A0A2Z7DC56_9LAMI|nr:hypothetical protein F511_38058 [Dorcoceras hygrometricum]
MTSSYLSINDFSTADVIISDGSVVAEYDHDVMMSTAADVIKSVEANDVRNLVSIAINSTVSRSVEYHYDTIDTSCWQISPFSILNHNSINQINHSTVPRSDFDQLETKLKLKPITVVSNVDHREKIIRILSFKTTAIDGNRVRMNSSNRGFTGKKIGNLRPRAENSKTGFRRTKRRNLAEKRLRSTAKLLSPARWTVSEGVALVSCENIQAGSDVKRRSIQMLERRSIQQLNQMLKTREVESDVEDKIS